MGCKSQAYKIIKNYFLRQKLKMITVIYLSLLFAVSELLLMLLRHSQIKTAKTRKDQGSMIFIWVMITLGFTSGFFLAKHDSWHPVNSLITGIGLMLTLAGIIVRWLAIIQLGKSFTVDVAITESARLKTDGLYKKIRHPSYFGLLLIIIGFSLTMNSLYSFLVFVIPVGCAVFYRISVEEKVLLHEFGDDYLNYRSKTKKLVPGIY
jgi:protein-S-isoprenylcysteine O-methyltransferase Ste14